MRYCHTCNAQFSDEHSKCLHCGRRLSSDTSARSDAETTALPPEAFRLLARRQPLKAVPLLDALAAAGVGFKVVAEGGTEHVNARFGSHGRYAAIEIYVHAEQLADAEGVLREELGASTEPASQPSEVDPGHCPACGAPVAEFAAECADCGLTFPE